MNGPKICFEHGLGHELKFEKRNLMTTNFVPWSTICLMTIVADIRPCRMVHATNCCFERNLNRTFEFEKLLRPVLDSFEVCFSSCWFHENISSLTKIRLLKVVVDFERSSLKTSSNNIYRSSEIEISGVNLGPTQNRANSKLKKLFTLAPIMFW